MKRCLVSLLVLGLALLFVAGTAQAGGVIGTEFTKDADATIDPAFGFTYFSLRQIDDPTDSDPWDNPEVDVMSFGTLTDFEPDGEAQGYMVSNTSFVTLMITRAQGRPYVVSSSGSRPTGSSGPRTAELPLGSFFVTPKLIPQDLWVYGSDSREQGDLTAGEHVGDPTPAAQDDREVFTSNPEGQGRILRAYYSIPPKVLQIPNQPDVDLGDYGWEPVTFDQLDATYSASVTIRMVEQ